MKTHRGPDFYEEKMAGGNLSDEERASYLDEITEVLAGMEKGLAILKKVGKQPDAKVLENQKRFQEIQRKLED